jgi:hypothetical protein
MAVQKELEHQFQRQLLDYEEQLMLRKVKLVEISFGASGRREKSEGCMSAFVGDDDYLCFSPLPIFLLLANFYFALNIREGV